MANEILRRVSATSNIPADGLAVDAQGRLYVASNAGIEVFSAGGKALGAIPLPKKPQNLVFSGVAKKSLYVVGRGSAYRLVLSVSSLVFGRKRLKVTFKPKLRLARAAKSVLATQTLGG